MKQHTVMGEQIIAAAGPSLERIGPLVRASHERWDGKGYPDGLAGEEIPLGARIITICDSFRAMLDVRAYKQAMSLDDALAELRRCCGHRSSTRRSSRSSASSSPRARRSSGCAAPPAEHAQGRTNVSGSGPVRRPASSASSASISASLSWKSKTSKFCAMRSGVTDFGITTLPSCRCQRITTWRGRARVALGDARDRRIVQHQPLRQRAPGLGRDPQLLVLVAQADLLQVAGAAPPG